jgi:predicted secreted Zn-dependent protease
MSRLFSSGLSALLWAIAIGGCSAGSARPRSSSLFSGIPNISFQYYDVSGTTAEEIRRAMNARRPTDTNDGQPVDALTSWSLTWGVTAGPNGCDLSQARIMFRAKVILPRLSDPASVPAPLRDRWQAFVAGLERHEAYHVRHAWENRSEVLRAIRASSCATWNQAAEAAIRRIAQEQRDYDVRTRHGATEVPSFH